MKKLLLSFAVILLATPFFKATTGGPDTYGYTWIDSNEPGGPAYSWIDITSTGTLVTGLTDDNSIGMIPMGMSFHYYWGDFNSVKIGSNGWIGFDNIGNIASCFPSIPTGGGVGDNYLAPLMSDLIFTGMGNTAQVYYKFDNVNNRFIISFIDVPFWQVAAPGYTGANSFQVILSNADSSITYQYQTTSYIAGSCAVNQLIGIEGPTGTIGLTHSQNAATAANYAVKFKYPPVVLIQVQDLTPLWTLNTKNQAEFFYTGNAISIPVNVKNSGNANVTTTYTVNVLIKNALGITVLNNTQTITGGLASGDDTTLIFSYLPTTVGQFSIQSTVTNANDINPGNNSKIIEFETVQINAALARLSNVNAGDSYSSTWSLSSGTFNDGGGLHIIPPSYPYIITKLGAYVVNSFLTSSNVTLELYDDSGVGNSPGNLIESTVITNNTASGWVASTLAIPDTIFSGGFYVVWRQDPLFPAISLGTYGQTPFSRRNYELVAGGWAEWRNNETAELMLEARGHSICTSFDAVAVSHTNVSCNGLADGSIDINVVGGTPIGGTYLYTWTNYSGTNEDPTGLASGLYQVVVTDANGCSNTEQIVISQPPAISSNVTSTNVDCHGGITGTASVLPSGGTGSLSVNWGSNDPMFLSAGNVIYSISDASGCVFVDTIVITEPAAIVLTATTVPANIGLDGSIDLTASGGTAPYIFQWSNGGGSIEDPTGLNAGTYTVTVTDANSCTSFLTVTLTSIAGLEETNSNAFATIYPNPSAGLYTIELLSGLDSKLMIMDLNGKIILESALTSSVSKIDLTKEEKGVYIARIMNSSGTFTSKLILH